MMQGIREQGLGISDARNVVLYQGTVTSAAKADYSKECGGTAKAVRLSEAFLVGMSTLYPTHDAMKLRHEWGTHIQTRRMTCR